MATNDPNLLNQSKIFNRKNNPDYYPQKKEEKFDLLPDGSKQFKLLKKNGKKRNIVIAKHSQEVNRNT